MASVLQISSIKEMLLMPRYHHFHSAEFRATVCCVQSETAGSVLDKPLQEKTLVVGKPKTGPYRGGRNTCMWYESGARK
jgi:hypothetical protein